MTGLAVGLILLTVARSGSALGKAVIDPTHNSLIADYYPIETRARVYSFHRGANALGAFIGPLSAGLLAYYFSWRVPFVVFVIPTVVFALIATPLEGAHPGQVGTPCRRRLPGRHRHRGGVAVVRRELADRPQGEVAAADLVESAVPRHLADRFRRAGLAPLRPEVRIGRTRPRSGRGHRRAVRGRRPRRRSAHRDAEVRRRRQGPDSFRRIDRRRHVGGDRRLRLRPQRVRRRRPQLRDHRRTRHHRPGRAGRPVAGDPSESPRHRLRHRIAVDHPRSRGAPDDRVGCRQLEHRDRDADPDPQLRDRLAVAAQRQRRDRRRHRAGVAVGGGPFRGPVRSTPGQHQPAAAPRCRGRLRQPHRPARHRPPPRRG